MRRLIVLGAGGHAKVLIDALLHMKRDVSGLSIPALCKGDPQILGLKIIGDDAELKKLGPSRIELVNGVGAKARRGDPGTLLRRRVFEGFRADGFSFCSVLGRGVTLASDFAMGEGSQVLSGAVIQPGVFLGDNIVINTAASIDHDCRIEAHAVISPGAVLCGNVTVGEGAFVGAGAVILPGVTIGQGAVVAAGATVRKSVGVNESYIA